MMKNKRNLLHRVRVSAVIVAAMLIGLTILYSTNGVVTGQTTWKAPAKAKDVKNPVKADAASLKKGKELFAANCVVCHGPKGAGDGVMAKNLKPKPAVLSKKTLENQIDGELFWKISEGKPPMPSFKATVSEKDRWSIVNYIRTL
jgi:mono/diheme cytochrome c family protein